MPCLLGGALLSGCLFGSNLRPAGETLIPEISEDGTKFFVLERRYTAPVPDQSGGRRQPAPDPSSAIDARVERILEQTGYCRQGYFELYRERRRNVLRVRGECREAATERDRQRFSGRTLDIQSPE